MRIGLICSFYNEELYIKDFYFSLKQFVNPCDIYFINDCSTDKSESILTNFHPQENIIRNEKNIGQGNSILKGINHLKIQGYDYAITMDCDLQHDPKEIKQFVSKLKSNLNLDVIVGSRYQKNSKEIGTQSKIRFLANVLFCDLFNKFYKCDISDCFSGYLLLNLDKFNNILLSSSYAWIIDFWKFVLRNNYSFEEITIDRIYLNTIRDFKGYYKSNIEIVADLLNTFKRNSLIDNHEYLNIITSHFTEYEMIYSKENITIDKLILDISK